MELNPAWVSATAAVVSIVVVVSSMLIKDAFAARDYAIGVVKNTQKTLFDKLDATSNELHVYKLHVAETYVNREVLREQLAPITEGLKEIRDGLRDDRRDGDKR